MANLQSPGVQVTVVDQSFYNAGLPGTIPLILVATGANKTNGAGTGTALYTTSSYANTLYLTTSQKDLTDNFGNPIFVKDSSGNPIHGSELSEYGLAAAYSFLGASNSAYILRANVDLTALTASSSEPAGTPADGTYWLDTSSTSFGIFEWDVPSQSFQLQTVNVYNDATYVSGPTAQMGNLGDYAIVTATSANNLWYKNSDGVWVEVGSTNLTVFAANGLYVAKDWKSSYPVVSSNVFSTLPASVNGSGATAQSVLGTGLNAGKVSSISVTAGGSGYGSSATATLTAPPTYTINTSAASSASTTITLTTTTGVLPGMSVSGTGLSVTGGGTSVTVSSVTDGTHIVVSNSVTVSSGVALTIAGVQATATATVVNGVITAITVTSAGAGYQSAPNITLASNNTPGFNITIGTNTVNYVQNNRDITSVATDLNNLINTYGVGVRIVGGALQFVIKSATVDSITLADPASPYTSLLGASNTLGITAGTYYAPAVQITPHTQVPTWRNVSNGVDTSRPSGSVWVKTTAFNGGAQWALKKWSSTLGQFQLQSTPIYTALSTAINSLDTAGGGIGIPVGTIFVYANAEHLGLVDFFIKIKTTAGATTTTFANVGGTFSGTETITISATTPGSSTRTNPVTLNMANASVSNQTSIAGIAQIINSSSLSGTVIATVANNKLTISHVNGGAIWMTAPASTWTKMGLATNAGLPTNANMYLGDAGDSTFPYAGSGTVGYIISPFNNLMDYIGYTHGPAAPSTSPSDGTLWYSSISDVDMMVLDIDTNDQKLKWLGIQNVTGHTNAKVWVQATAPATLIANSGDIWVNTSNFDNYGRDIRRFNQTALTWDPIDVTDHTSGNGIIFADARYATSGSATTAGTIAALATSNYVDPDAPDPTLYPRGTLLWNTRRSGWNIKQYRANYINVLSNNGYNPRYTPVGQNLGESMSGYSTARWVSVSGSDLDNVAYFARKAQRHYVVGQMKAALQLNQQILDGDNTYFNLIAAPGYPELIVDMVNLNTARGGTALVVGDTPMRLDNSANSLVNYGNDYYNSGQDGEQGLHTKDDHLAVYYPSGLATDLTGASVVVPPSHMMLRTIAINDQKAYQWFAPAGTRRGGITNVSSVGYLSTTGSYIPVSLNQGTRDQMATVEINPITNIPGAGLVAFGQYTRVTAGSTAMDRVNVARLVSYLRRQLTIISKPFLFEPNDSTTQSQIKTTIESLLLDLVSLRGVYDYLVVCDSTNNTPSVIAANQLIVDVAIEPVKSVEFIYIPLILQNIGTIKKAN
jgi:Phage tail sheath C-terminal domain